MALDAVIEKYLRGRQKGQRSHPLGLGVQEPEWSMLFLRPVSFLQERSRRRVAALQTAQSSPLRLVANKIEVDREFHGTIFGFQFLRDRIVKAYQSCFATISADVIQSAL